MCGLFGWQISDEARGTFSLEAVTATLMIRNELRGKDSWGVIIYHDNKMRMLKQVGSIIKSKAILKFNGNQVLAHTRKATTGDVTFENAHPFDMGRIVGAHNGIISNHTMLQKKYKRNFSVDSQHLLAHINDKLDLKEISGYGVVTYIDKNKPGEVYLGVGDSGDLAIAGIGIPSKTTGILWSSNWTALEDALDISGVPKYYQIKVDKSRLYKVLHNDIYNVGKFDLSYGSSLYPSNYNEGVYEHCGYHGNYLPLDKKDDSKKKALKSLSRKKRKKLSKAFREWKNVIIAGQKALDVNHSMNTTMPSFISQPTHVGYV